MEIKFDNSSIEKLCSSYEKAFKKLGKKNADKLFMRIAALEMATTYTTPIAFHPGEYLREWLEENNMTSKELALRLGGKPEKTISNILTGKSAITPAIAEALSYVTGVPSHIWNNLQAKYNGYLASQTVGDTHEAQWDTSGE